MEQAKTTPNIASVIEEYLESVRLTRSQNVARFYKYLAAERLAEINWARLELLIKQHTRRLAIRLPQFPTNNIERVLDFVSNITFYEAEPETERLRAARDRAFVLTLADTGLRVHEACNLRLGARS